MGATIAFVSPSVDPCDIGGCWILKGMIETVAPCDNVMINMDVRFEMISMDVGFLKGVIERICNQFRSSGKKDRYISMAAPFLLPRSGHQGSGR